MKCPICTFDEFYIKNPEDEYDMWDIVEKQGIVYWRDKDLIKDFAIIKSTVIFCKNCTWKGQLESILKLS